MSDTDTAVATEVKTKTKAVPTDFLLDIASEVENLSKTKALNMASTLAENIETNYFKLGGVLKVIFTNAWFEGYESFDMYVYEKFGFGGRKAQYLMGIYDSLVTKMIPWEKVHHLGWTKLKDLASVLTPENVDEWVAKAEPLTVVQLQALLKAQKPSEEAGSTTTTTDTKVMKFVLKNDQIETVTKALAKVKAEIQTDHDNVALENLCAAHLAGVGGSGGVTTESLTEVFKAIGFEKVLEIFGSVFPNINLEATET